MAVTIKDVAKKAGVSSATVSRVLSHQSYVREEVRMRVLQAAKELNYQPNRVARSFRANRSKIIGLIVSDILNPFYTSLVRSVEDIASRNGYAVFLCNTDENPQKEETYIDFMIGERVAGVLLTPVFEESVVVNRLLEAGIPVVCLDRKIKNVILDTVMVNNLDGAYQVVSHLIDIGHQRIGAIVGENCTTGLQREDGYRNALVDHNISVKEDYIQRGAPREQDGSLLARKLLSLPNPPNAVFCGNNLLTIGTLREINAQGMKVPDDIAIAGFDDLEWYGLVEPTITAVYQPVSELGSRATEILFQRIGGDQSEAKMVLLNPELRIRRSSGGVVVD
ncbi:MAG: LacI family DNA-binding transcriptional regulator [Anaerolineales bacterium]|nr:LacI family DNA-binding transcriptional regulator [Anaerolineales bacterium]